MQTKARNITESTPESTRSWFLFAHYPTLIRDAPIHSPDLLSIHFIRLRLYHMLSTHMIRHLNNWSKLIALHVCAKSSIALLEFFVLLAVTSVQAIHLFAHGWSVGNTESAMVVWEDGRTVQWLKMGYGRVLIRIFAVRCVEGAVQGCVSRQLQRGHTIEREY